MLLVVKRPILAFRVQTSGRSQIRQRAAVSERALPRLRCATFTRSRLTRQIIRRRAAASSRGTRLPVKATPASDTCGSTSSGVALRNMPLRSVGPPSNLVAHGWCSMAISRVPNPHSGVRAGPPYQAIAGVLRSATLQCACGSAQHPLESCNRATARVHLVADRKALLPQAGSALRHLLRRPHIVLGVAQRNTSLPAHMLLRDYSSDCAFQSTFWTNSACLAV
jgi:hypothetical protein